MRVLKFSVDLVEPNASFDATVGNTVAITRGATAEHVATGDAVELLEAVSRRVPYGSGTPETIRRAFDGLGRAFDQIND